MNTFLKQTNEPLFPEILWETPQNKKAAKKLLIIGGNSQRFDSVQKIYSAALAAGIGDAKIVLPDSLKPVIGDTEGCLFVPSTRSGSLGRSALNEILAFSREADGLILGGDLSKNPDTTVLLENILNQVNTPIALGDEVISLLLPSQVIAPNWLLVASTQTLIKRAGKLGLPIEIRGGQSLMNKISFGSKLYELQPASYVLLGLDLLVFTRNKCSLTTFKTQPTAEQTIAYMMTFKLQHPKTFAALTTAAYKLSQL